MTIDEMMAQRIDLWKILVGETVRFFVHACMVRT